MLEGADDVGDEVDVQGATPLLFYGSTKAIASTEYASKGVHIATE